MPEANNERVDAPAPETDHEGLSGIAGQTLDHFEETATAARDALRDASPSVSNVLAVVNTVTADAAVRNVRSINSEQRRELERLAAKPAIARVVAEDDDGVRKTYFISDATPHGNPKSGHAVASYRSAFGRLASLPVGGEAEVLTPKGLRNFAVVERAELHPSLKESGWDSLNTVVQSEVFGPFTITSFRDFLRSRTTTADEDELDLLEAALAEDRAAGLIVEGRRRDALSKMALRELSLLDQYQDEIFRLPIDTRLVILGPPGTGKTTTLIKRLGLKVDQTHLTQDERDVIKDTADGTARHAESWLMFTPTTLLKQYIKEAFNRENIAAPDDRIQTWDDFRLDLARNKFAILRSASGSGSFVLKSSLNALLPETITAQKEWFSDFDAWQANEFWSELQTQAESLRTNKAQDIARLGTQLKSTLPTESNGINPSAFVSFGTLSDEVQGLIARLKEASDKSINSAITAEYKARKEFIDELTAFVAILTEPEDSDDADGDDDDDTRQIRLGRDAAVDALRRAIRAKARAAAAGRTLSKQTRNGKLVEWLGTRGPAQADLKSLGESLQVQAAAKRFLNPLKRYIDGLPRRYRRYRRERQAEGRWYTLETLAATDLHPLEVDVILLATLKGGRALLGDRRLGRDFAQGRHAQLSSVRDLYRTQVIVDEATDFSPVQLSCMACLCDPAAQSFVACGDFNQRITDWGSRSNADLTWVFSDFEIRPISITYRHSKQLNELARAIALLSSPDAPEVQLPQRVNNDGFEPVLAINLADATSTASWLGKRMAEIEHLTKTPPPIAVLVHREEDVEPLASALNAILADRNIRAAPCRNGQLAGQDNDVRVFDIQHIKGLEFEAVFFVSIDQLAARKPELFDKYLYVGATRAAMYLGMTCAGPALPPRIASLQDRFRSQWL